MTLPTIRAATIALPRRGRHGILWSPAQGDDACCEAALRAPGGAALPSLTALVSLAGLPESLEQAAGAEARAAAKPLTARSRARRDRRRHQEEELAEARRALLWQAPGDWDAGVFCGIHRRLLEAGRWDAASGLAAVAAQMSELALRAGHYRVPRPRAHDVRLPGAPYGAQWIGSQSMSGIDAAVEHRQMPPLVCTPLSPLDATIALRRIYPRHLLVMSFEATDFSESGSGTVLGAVDSRSAAQQEVFLRTSLDYNNRAAALLCRGGVTPQGLLTSQTNPYIYAAPRVAIFRGPADKGYPFFDEREQTVTNVLVCGRSSQRPMMQRHGEYFSNKDDVVALMERLQLLAQAALDPELMQVDGETDVDSHLAHGRKPVLVLAANDLAHAGAPQPRHSIALALKSWRQLHCAKFEAVVVAGGDGSTAQLMDKFINFDIYAAALGGAVSFCDWHWHPALLELSVNRTLANLAARRQPTAARSPRAPGTDEGGREEATAHARGGGQAAAPTVPPRPPLGAADPQQPPAAALAVLAAGVESYKPPAAPRVTGMDSRTAHEIALANRMADRYVHDPMADAKKKLDKSRADNQPSTTFAGAKSMASFQSKQEREAQQKMMRNKIEALADSLEMPEELKVHVVATICDEKMLSRQHRGGHHDHTENTPPLQSEVKQIASELDARLQRRRDELLPPEPSEVLAGDGTEAAAAQAGVVDILPKIGRLLPTGGRGITSNLIQQHEALNIPVGATDLA